MSYFNKFLGAIKPYLLIIIAPLLVIGVFLGIGFGVGQLLR